MLNVEGMLKFEVNGSPVELTKEDLLIDMSQKEGYVSEENNGMTVVLDTNLTEELIEEGFVFEIISKIQTMRKESGFEVTDHIRVSVSGNDRVAQLAKKNEASIAGKVLAESISENETFGNTKSWNVNGEDVTISVEKV